MTSLEGWGSTIELRPRGRRDAVWTAAGLHRVSYRPSHLAAYRTRSQPGQALVSPPSDLPHPEPSYAVAVAGQGDPVGQS
jgi:hypothetical protein